MLIENPFQLPDLMLRTMVGLSGAIIFSIASIRVSALSRSGALAAIVIGTTATAAGWAFAFMLAGFFLSATAVSKFRARVKDARLSGIVEKGGPRDAWQVIANGAVFAAGASWMIFSPDLPVLFAAAGALAGASADTWATEIGSLSAVPPRSILNGQRVPAGTSGGVTLRGVMAAAVGGTLVGLLGWISGLPGALVPACFAAGLAGTSADSLLGASLQSRRWCERCQEFTERQVHICGSATAHASGRGWLDNDMVNLLCTLVAAGVAALCVL